MNQADELEGAEGIEIPEGVDGERDVEFRKSRLIPILVIASILLVQAVSANIIVRKVFFSQPPAKKMENKADFEPIGEVYRIDGIIVNPQGTEGKSVLLVDVGLDASGEEVMLQLGKLEPQIRDNLVTFLSAQRVDVLTDIHMREKIRKKVEEIVNYYLKEGQVKQVFFISYVFQ